MDGSVVECVTRQTGRKIDRYVNKIRFKRCPVQQKKKTTTDLYTSTYSAFITVSLSSLSGISYNKSTIIIFWLTNVRNKVHEAVRNLKNRIFLCQKAGESIKRRQKRPLFGLVFDKIILS